MVRVQSFSQRPQLNNFSHDTVPLKAFQVYLKSIALEFYSRPKILFLDGMAVKHILSQG